MSELKHKTVALGELCSRVCSGGTPKSNQPEYYHGGTIPWLNTKEISFNRIRSTERSITQAGLDNSAAKWIEANSVIVAMYGATAGKSAISKIRTTTNQACCNLTIDPNIADYRFVFYCLLNSYEALLGLANGGAQQNLNAQTIKQFLIPLPTLEKQRKIAAILSALDDAIELNNRLNDYLEECIDALFKEKVLQNISEWSEASLLDIATYKNGLAMQKFRPADGDDGLPVLKIKELNQGYCAGDAERCSSNIDKSVQIKDGDLVFSWSGTLLLDFWAGGSAGLNQHLFKVTSDNYPVWFYYLWTKHHMRRFIALAADRATTMGHIKRSALEESKVYIPDDFALSQLELIFQPLVDEMIGRKVESRKFGALRDALLPKLMSGEIDVSKVDITQLNQSFCGWLPRNMPGSLTSSLQLPSQ